MICAAVAVLAALGFLGFEARKAYWDGKVGEMCEKQGGIRVFRVVQLDAKEYDKLLDNRNRIRLSSERFAAPEDLYVYSIEEEHIVRGQLEVIRHVQRVLKRPERAILSEHVGFARVGGDFFAVAHSSSFGCSRKEDSLFEQTFSRRQGEGS